MTDATGDSDEILAARAAAGDRASYEIIVKRHKERLYRFVRRYVGQQDDAYDILQEAFLAAWLNLGRYDNKRPFQPWLYTIAINKCRDFARRRKVRRLLLLAYAAEVRPEDGAPFAAMENDSEERERLRRLDAAIAGLPAFYKEPLLLTAIGAFSQQQAADVLKTTPKAVEMRLRRARQRLELAILQNEAEGSSPPERSS